ncbi:skin secretory protein xP2-like [Accipiter gentilis]|uniref:skin secretory protein xP2-like n=1 Tax=Astur gentilis TaxID=8957 RepID=UPI00210FAEE2|nr:skin secretory protein xP2-like [Accipiter gentilis]
MCRAGARAPNGGSSGGAARPGCDKAGATAATAGTARRPPPAPGVGTGTACSPPAPAPGTGPVPGGVRWFQQPRGFTGHGVELPRGTGATCCPSPSALQHQRPTREGGSALHGAEPCASGQHHRLPVQAGAPQAGGHRARAGLSCRASWCLPTRGAGRGGLWQSHTWCHSEAARLGSALGPAQRQRVRSTLKPWVPWRCPRPSPTPGAPEGVKHIGRSSGFATAIGSTLSLGARGAGMRTQEVPAASSPPTHPALGLCRGLSPAVGPAGQLGQARAPALNPPAMGASGGRERGHPRPQARQGAGAAVLLGQVLPKSGPCSLPVAGSVEDCGGQGPITLALQLLRGDAAAVPESAVIAFWAQQ